MNFTNLVARQNNFINSLKEKMDSSFPNWKELSYDCVIPVEDNNDKETEANFPITHLFYLRDVCDEEPDEEAEKARKLVASVYEGSASYPFAFFDRITCFLIHLQSQLFEKPVVLFAQEPVEVWEQIGDAEISTTDKYLNHYAKTLKSLGINYVKWDEAEKIKDLDATHLLVIDLASDDECMDIIFQKVFEFYPSSKPVLAYFSLVKQCSEDEMDVFRERIRQKQEAEEKERQRKLAEELERQRKAAEELERKRKAAEERRLRKEALEKAKKLEAAQRKICLTNLVGTLNRIRISGRKADSKKILQILKEQGIEYLYHFTDASNLESIKAQKGLYSREYCEKNNIVISRPGGDGLSIMLDARYNLRDYVRLSFNKTNPMINRLRRNKSYNLVWLKIKLDVALAKETLFSDMNATKLGHHLGGRFEDFQKVDFEAVKTEFLCYGTPQYNKHQAEVLVKTFIPIEYIVNIDNPDLI